MGLIGVGNSQIDYKSPLVERYKEDLLKRVEEKLAINKQNGTPVPIVPAAIINPEPEQ